MDKTVKWDKIVSNPKSIIYGWVKLRFSEGIMKDTIE